MYDYRPLIWPALSGFVLGILAFFIVPIALLGAHWDAKGRGDLPAWAWWLRTPDERLPGGLHEPSVKRCYDSWGRFITSWYWLGIRNRAHGWAFQWARPLDGAWGAQDGYQEASGGLWWQRTPILGGRFTFKAGWRNYFVDGKWWGVPCLSITVA